jgi:hypothetical protein
MAGKEDFYNNDKYSRYCIDLIDEAQINYLEDRIAGEMAMWRAVITQALQDAGSKASTPSAKFDKFTAIAWLSGISMDFLEVCLFAGLDPEYVKAEAKKAIKRGCIWRKEKPKRKPSRLKNQKPNKQEKQNCTVVALRKSSRK